MSSEKILIVDGYSILHRAFYGVRLLTNSSGFPTNAIFGFFGILQRILDQEQPTHLCVAFDTSAPTFRHQMFDDYKGTRKSMPDELRQQVPVLKDLLKAMEISVVSLPGYEADDLLGTLSRRFAGADMDVRLLSGDRDMLQLATDRICICLPHTKGGETTTERYFAQDVEASLGVTPEEFISVKALMGDSSDNIPGVPKVGPKTATELIQQWHSLDALYAHLDEVPNARTRGLLAEHENLARMSYTLARICLDAPIELEAENCRFHGLFTPAAYGILRDLEIHSLLRRFPADIRAEGEALYAARRKDKFPGKTVYGLTGGVGSGKSTVLRMLKEEYGAFVLEADRVSEELMQPGGASYEAVCRLIGPDCLRADGQIDREALSAKLFAHDELREQINAVVHPDTLAEVRRRIGAAQEKLVVYESALPKQAHFDEFCDAVLYVHVPEQQRLERLFFGRGYSFEKSLAIMKKQLSEAQFRALADAEIDNSGDEAATRASLARAMKQLAHGETP